MSASHKFETKAIRIQSERTNAKEHSTPTYLTSSFTFDNAEEMRAAFADEIQRNIYSRFSNPSVEEFTNKMVALENAEAGFSFASGMAAVFNTFAALCNSGDHIVSARSVFGSTHSVFTKMLPKWDIETSYADIDKPESWEELIKENTKLVYVETPTNPGVDVVDMNWLGKLCKKHNVLFVVDNCFATPYLQTPTQYGADLVIHSATKYLDGQGRVMGGVVVGNEELINEIYLFARSTGPALSPFNAWVLSKSLETLAVRMDKHCENALALANYLETNEEVETVKYPFLPSHPQHDIAQKQMKQGGGIVTFNIKGGLDRGRKFLDALSMCSLTANLGDTRTIVTHPASTTHAKLTEEERKAVGISSGLIRVSAGLEHITDIIDDIQIALDMSK